MPGKRIKIVILAYDGAQTLEFASLDGAPVVGESGLRMIPDGSLDSIGTFDTLIVPGGAALHAVRTSADVAEAVIDLSLSLIEEDYGPELALNVARDHLSGSAAPIDAVARVVGFRSDDAFRRAFDRRFGISPSGNLSDGARQ